MDLYFFSIISAYSITVAVVIGLVRFKQIDKSYRPFIIICILALLTELVSSFTIRYYHFNAIPYNLYGIAEAILYMILFRNWGEFNMHPWKFTAVIVFLSATWVINNLILHSILTINPLYMIVYSFTLIFIAINQLTRLIVTVRKGISTDSRFLICISIVIFFSYYATLQVFYVLHLNFSNNFYDRIQLSQEIINFIINLTFAFAILWIPRKQKFILPFS